MMGSQTEGETSKAQAPAASVLTVQSTTANAGSTVNVNVNVVAQGNETQYGFVLNFDPNVLSFTGTSAAGTTTATSASCNLIATPGEIVCLVSGFKNNLKGTSEMFGEISSGEQILISPQFVLAEGTKAGTESKVSITDASASNEAAQPLVMKANSGMVNVLKTKPVKRDKRFRSAGERSVSNVFVFERVKWTNQYRDDKLFRIFSL
jgi:hypothetical protein